MNVNLQGFSRLTQLWSKESYVYLGTVQLQIWVGMLTLTWNMRPGFTQFVFFSFSQNLHMDLVFAGWVYFVEIGCSQVFHD